MKTANARGQDDFSFQLDEFYLDLQENGNNISILSHDEIVRRPFPGLRPFKTSEFQLFNGRVGQAEELIKRLKKNRFLSVIGSSGTGKSSLVRAGLIPQLFGGYLHEAGSKWNIAICRPGKDPVENLAIALSSINNPSKQTEELRNNFNTIEPLLSSSIYGLLDVKELLDARTTGVEPHKLLVIIDQFEELFRFDRKDLGKENIENQFVNLLLKASLDPRNSVYVIITMRSEFLGDSVKYRGLPEAINEGQYLVPQLTRNELKEVIENPVHLAGKKISSSLVELLVNEIEESKLKENLDQLPILQHALMRTYNEAMKDGPETEIGYDHFIKTGGMEKALANHAEAKFRELGDPNLDEKALSTRQQIAKIIFQSLTDLGADQKGGRRPTELKTIYGILAALKVTEQEVDEVVNHFRDSDTSFIMPPINTELYPSLIIDISHESLMRNWSRLNEWIVEEMKQGNIYRRLNERRELHEQDNEEWLRGVLLRELLDWRNNYTNNAIWANRYQDVPKESNEPDLKQRLYHENLEFLNDSELISERLKEDEKREMKETIAREQREQSNRNRNRIFAVATSIAVLFGIWAFAESNNATHQQKLAEQNLDSAKKQKLLADASALKASDYAAKARAQQKIAEEQRAIAEEKSELAYKQSKQLAKYAAEAESQRNIALSLKDSAETKKDNYEKQLVKNALKNESFYFSNAISQAEKEAIIDSLFKAPFFDTKQIDVRKFINPDLLEFINQAVQVKEYIRSDQAIYLAAAQAIWKDNQHPVIKNLLLSIVNDNIFPKETISVSPGINLNTTRLSVSDNHIGFAFNNNNQVVTGKYNDGKLVIDENSFDTSFSRFYCLAQGPMSTYKTINSINYSDSGQVVALVDSFKVELNPDGQLNKVGLLPGLKNVKSGQLSPDGRHALTVDRDGNVLLWSAGETADKTRTDTINNYRNKVFGTDNMNFSPNSEYALLNIDGRARVLNLHNKVRGGGSAELKNEYTRAASFTPDSKFIITVLDGKISVRDTMLSVQDDFRDIDLKSIAFKQSEIQDDKINSIAISKDWKKMLIGQKDYKVFLVENKKGSLLFKENENNLRIKELGIYPMKASFYNDSTVITIDGNGAVSLWNIHPDFTDPDSAIVAVFPVQSLLEKLLIDSLSFAEVMASPQRADLNIAAGYYFRNEKIDYAKKIYERLLKESPTAARVHYITKLLEVNSELNVVDRVNKKLEPNSVQLDTARAYRYLKTQRLKENVVLSGEMTRLCPGVSAYTKNLWSIYGSLSFNQLFIYDFEGAIISAKKGLDSVKAYPEFDWIYTNLALGYLLSGKYRLAEEIYREYKDRTFSNNTENFRNAFLLDLKDLEDAGVFKNISQTISTDVAKIREILNEPPLKKQMLKPARGY